jgi:hypothetical protein
MDHRPIVEKSEVRSQIAEVNCQPVCGQRGIAGESQFPDRRQSGHQLREVVPNAVLFMLTAAIKSRSFDKMSH